MIRRGVPTALATVSVMVAGAACSGNADRHAPQPDPTIREESLAMARSVPGSAPRTVLEPFSDSVTAAREITRGAVVLFRYPHDTSRRLVRRVMGLPGDTLATIDGVLHVNGTALAEPYVQQADTVRAARPDHDHWGPLVVPAGRYFLLGDDRDHALDSRYWGSVGVGHMIGVVRTRRGERAPRE